MRKSLTKVNLRIDPEDYDQIIEYARERRIPIAALLRGMIKDGLSGIDRKQEVLLQSYEDIASRMSELIEELRICTQMSAASVAVAADIGCSLLMQKSSNESAESIRSRRLEFKSELVQKSFRVASDICVAYEDGVLERRGGENVSANID